MAIFSGGSVVLGTANAQSVVAAIGSGTDPWQFQSITLSANYSRSPPKDFPRAAAEVFQGSNWTEFGVIPSGSTIKVYAAEAQALINAGAGS